MSNLTNMPEGPGAFRKKLLAGVSASSLAILFGVAQAAAADSKPAFWLEFGAQFERRSGEDAPFVPMFTQALIDRDMLSPLEMQKPPQYSFGGEGKISYQPGGSDWTFSAAILFGRSNGDKHRYQTKPLDPVPFPFGSGGYFPRRPATADILVHHKESHAILDFEAGKDVGLGLFGRGGTSSVGFGVRIAQFGAKENLTANAIPTELISFPPPPAFPLHAELERYTVSSQADRNFRGIGPSVSWSGAAPIAGNSTDAQLALDWGVHGAVLFGRQRTNLHQATTDDHKYNYHFYQRDIIHNYTDNVDRARSLLVPNVGATLALSLKFPNAKVTIGYRADEFLNAMDTGIDTRKASNVLFHGPFASFSIGVSPFDL